MWFLILILTSVVIIIFGKQLRQKITLIRWRKSLNLNQHLQVFQKLYVQVDGFSLSKHARKSKDAFEYVYGEIDFESFIALLTLCKPNSSTVFYDLGSGTGKAVIACAMVFKVHKSCGIELFSSLHQASLLQQQRLSKLADYQLKAETISFINDDFMKIRLNDASIVFINATAFFGETWKSISKHLEALQTGTLVITTSKPLYSSNFITLHKTTVAMSWGPVFSFIQRRIG